MCDVSAKFERCEIMVDGCLASSYGNGKTPVEAISNFIDQIAGKRIALNAGSDNRREFDVPLKLSLGQALAKEGA